MSPTPINHAAVLQILVKDNDRHEVDISQLQADLVSLKVTIASLATKVGIYAAIGAALGGAAIGAVVTLIMG